MILTRQGDPVISRVAPQGGAHALSSRCAVTPAASPGVGDSAVSSVGVGDCAHTLPWENR